MTRSDEELLSTTNNNYPYAVDAHEFAKTFTVVAPDEESAMTAENTLHLDVEDDETPVYVKLDKPVNDLLPSIACDKSVSSSLSMLNTDLGSYNAEFLHFLSSTDYSDESCASDWSALACPVTSRLQLKLLNAQSVRLSLVDFILHLSERITRDLQVLCVTYIDSFCALLYKKPIAQLFSCYPHYKVVIQRIVSFFANRNSNTPKTSVIREELLSMNDDIISLCYTIAAEFFKDIRKYKVLEEALLTRKPAAFDAVTKHKDRIDPFVFQKYEIFLSRTSSEDIKDILSIHDRWARRGALTRSGLNSISPFKHTDYICVLDVILHKGVLNFYSNYREKFEPHASALSLFVDKKNHYPDDGLQSHIDRQLVLLREEIRKYQDAVRRWNTVGHQRGCEE